MDDDSVPSELSAAPLDPVHGDPRALMQALIPAARSAYMRAWEMLADPGTPLERRRAARARAAAVAGDHAVVAEVLRGREASLGGNDLHNVRHLASELERHVEALGRMASLPMLGLQESKELRPEALGCGKGYRMPATSAGSGETGSRVTRDQPRAKHRDDRAPRRGNDQPFSDRGPKAPRDALGTSKHDSPLGDDLDEATRAKLEALRQQLES